MGKAFALASLALLVLLLGCIQPPPQSEDLSGFKDCGESQECLMEALENCGQAFATQRNSDNNVTTQAKTVVYGLDGEKCRVKFTIEDIKVDVKGEGGEIADMIASLLKGKEMVCFLPSDEKASLNNLDKEAIGEYCSGPLVDVMKMAENRQP